MKFSLSWLREYLDTDASVAELSVALTSLGLEVDGIEDPAEKLAGFTIAEITAASQHPDADKLQVCTVNTGSETIQVVCGAPNARAGLKGVFAPSGTHVPGIDLTLKATKIRGVESNGMMCSERELELSDEHEGIIDLPSDAPVGAAYVDYAGLNDPVFEIGLTPNRGDCAGVYGIARDLAAKGIGTLKPLPGKPVAGQFDNPITIAIRDDAAAACPAFAGRLIKGVKNGPSPDWLQKRLTAIGLRPISALVDITNFFTHGMARPLHVYDAGKLTGGITVGLTDGSEAFDALNDKHYDVPAGVVSINDDAGFLGLGGVVGGVSSGVDENTTDVLLECALFDPIKIAEAGRAMQIDSDARYRFERGVDPATVTLGTELATAMILEICGGDASAVTIAGNIPVVDRDFAYRPERTETLGGLYVDLDEQRAILERLGFTIRTDGSPWMVMPPSWRPDIEGEADIVEEVLRVHGYDRVPAAPMERDQVVTDLAVGLERQRAGHVRRVLAARGLDEAVTWSFLAPAKADLFGGVGEDLHIINPISTDLAVMRPSPLPNLIEAAGRNADRGMADVAIFEVGPAFETADETGQRHVAAGIRLGHGRPRHWADAARSVDAYDAKADALTALQAAGLPTANPQMTADANSWYHPGRSGVFRLGKNVLAQFGEVHPSVAEAFGIDQPLVAFEVFIDAVPVPKKKSGPARPKLERSTLQPVSRDFAFVVKDEVSADKLLRAAMTADKKLITHAELFDVYAGKGVADGHKSLAISVTLQPINATLTDAEIETVAKAVVAQVEKQTGGSLR
ncbi:MAG: phenylalanine--tRNA ligase subunit beta [Pseudomonadota bacterium]